MKESDDFSRPWDNSHARAGSRGVLGHVLDQSIDSPGLGSPASSGRRAPPGGFYGPIPGPEAKIDYSEQSMNTAKAKSVVALICATLLLGLGPLACGRKGDSRAAGNQMKAVSVSIAQYAASHSGRLPPFESLGQLETLLLPSLVAPGEKNPRFGGAALAVPLLARPETHEPYVFNAKLSGKLQNDYPRPEAIVVFYERHENYGGRLVAFLDGHHVWASNDEWGRIRIANGL